MSKEHYIFPTTLIIDATQFNGDQLAIAQDLIKLLKKKASNLRIIHFSGPKHIVKPLLSKISKSETQSLESFSYKQNDIIELAPYLKNIYSLDKICC